MKFFPLVWAQLWRKRPRTTFTLLSLVAAFLLLGLLQAASALFSMGSMNLSEPVLITQARVSFTSPLPLGLLPRIEAVPGVDVVGYGQFFGGKYHDERNFFPSFATVPERWVKVFRECVIAPEEFRAWTSSRTAAVVGSDLMTRMGWKIGDRVPMTSMIWPQKDGSRNWTFDIVGTVRDRTAGSCPRLNNFYLRFDYLDEARQFGQGLAGMFYVRVKNPDQAQAVATAVDALFENSPDETKTQTERDFALNMSKQVGNLSLILNAILGAVFFTILLLTGNTMAQTVRERIPELAVLKTLGFSDGAVLWLILVEALLLCVLGAALGMGLAKVVVDVIAKVETQFPAVHMVARIWWIAAGSALLLGLAVGLPPALRARRLSIVDALAGR